ncbi:MAG: SusC/RagA family TonB-linked outer membrane protein, partial [Odoribacter sp.]
IILGVVKDKKGEPIPGVTVILKGTTIGVSSDHNGAFSLTLLPSQEGIVLQFSYIGMKNKEVKYNGEAFLKVIMEEDIAEIDEVVVTGYQKIKKTRMTGAVEVVTAQDIANKGFVSIEDVLKGQLAGVTAMSITGRPGAQAQIRVRGINSLTGNTDPIWIVDGMPLQGDLPDVGLGATNLQNTVLTSGIGNLAPDDIESITILKDAAATAIYGSRAANGVIVVTTKRGQIGKSYFNVQATYSLDEAPKSKLQMMNTSEKIAFETGLYNDFQHIKLDSRIFKALSDADHGMITRDEANAEINRLRKINTNWYDEIFRVAQSQNYVVSLSGGTETTQYYASINYMGQEGVMPNNKYDKLGISLKLTHDFNRKLRVYFDVNTNLRNDRSSASSVDPLEYATYANPYEKPYNEDGSYAYDRSYFPDLSAVKDGYKYDFNVIEDLNNNTQKTKYISNQINLKLEYKIWDALMFSTHGTFSNTSSHLNKMLGAGTFSSKYNAWMARIYQEREIPDYMNNGSINEKTVSAQSYTWRNQLEYAKNFKERHFVSVVVGQEMSEDKSNSFSYYSPEYDPNYGLIGFPDLSGIAATKLGLSSLMSRSEEQSRSVSFFATGSYSYMDRYVVSGSYRLDGVDIIGTDNRFTPLWNASFKYNLHNEEFIKSISWIDVLSLRGSYGFTGSIDHNAYPFTILSYRSSSYRYQDDRIPSTITPGNPSIKWQRKEDRSVGVDGSLFRNRVNFSVNYYNNITRDLLDRKKLAVSSGREQVKANVASLRNEGWEFSLNTVNIDYKKFRWTTAFNIAINRNTVMKTYYKNVTDLPQISKSYDKTNSSYFVEGQPVEAWYGYKFAGVDPATGHTLAYIDAVNDNGYRLGHSTEDGNYVVDMDTEFTNKAVSFMGEAYPPVSGGFSTQFTLDRFSLSAHFSFMAGHKIKSFRSSQGGPIGAGRYNQLTDELYRWRKVGDVTDVPAYVSGKNAWTNYFFSSEVENGSFLKCNNISLGYNMPQNLCDKLLLTRARINFNVQNLFTSTHYRGLDPENMGAFGYPSARRFVFSLNLGI